MARILGRLVFIFFVFAVVTGGASAYTFTSTEGRFTAVFPGAPKLEKSSGKTDSGNPYQLSNWAFGSSDGTEAWMILMGTYSKPVLKDYVANISGAVAGVKGKLVSQKTIRQNGVEGREILVDLPSGSEARERMLWIGDRFHQIMFIGKPGARSTPNVDAYFNSFQATK